MLGLNQFLAQENKQGTNVYPKPSDVFNAFNLTPFNEVKVVILGQDPYHGANQAYGLSFSVQKGVAVPPSLKNIYKELQADILGFNIPSHGDLSSWAKQGVLLLNVTLTVRANEPGSHQKMGWEQFTDNAIKALSAEKSGLVFILWGRHAQAKASLIDSGKHLVLTATHPSPFSAYNGFFGCKHFSKANAYLLTKGEKPINWQID
jgi:uracil-DNA glycosylase